MKRSFGFYIILSIIITFAGCSSNTKDSLDKDTVKPIIETTPVYSAPTTPSAVTSEPTITTNNSSTDPSTIAGKSASNSNIEEIIFTLVHSNKDMVIQRLGNDFEIVNAGGDGPIEGYRYKDLGLTFAFDDGIDVSWIDCDDNIEIRGARGGMTFSQIQSKLGKAPVYDTFISSPEYKAYEINYKIDNGIVEFFSRYEDGKESTMTIYGNYWQNVGKVLDDKGKENYFWHVNELENQLRRIEILGNAEEIIDLNKTYIRGRVIKISEIINAENNNSIRVLATFNNGSYELYSGYGNSDFRYYRNTDHNGNPFKEIKEIELIKDNSSNNYKIKVTSKDKTSTFIKSIYPDEGWIDLSGGQGNTLTDSSKNVKDIFKLMYEESIGFLRIGLSNVEVTNELGEPTEKSEAVEWGADGAVHQSWYYKTTGVELDMIGNSGALEVSSIKITAPCKYKTKRGIGIGSSRKDIIEAYKDEISMENYTGFEEPIIVAGSFYGGVIFSFENDTVSRIFIGAAGE